MSVRKIFGLVVGVCLVAALGYVAMARTGQFQLTREELIERYRDEQSKFVRVKDMDLHYKDEGQGPPVLLLHGSFSSLHTWDGVVERLKGQYRLIRMDQPPLALSGDVPKSNDGLLLEDFIAAFLDEIGVEKVALAGVSSGGIVAYRFAAKYPERAMALMITNSPSAVVDNEATGTSLALNTLIYLNTNVFKHQTKLYWRTFLKSLFAEPSRVTDAMAQRYYDTNRKIRAPIVPSMRSRVNDTAEIDGVLARVHAPTLLLWGTPDRVLPESMGRQLQTKLSGTVAELVILDGGGHYPPLEAPELIAPRLGDFLAKNVSP